MHFRTRLIAASNTLFSFKIFVSQPGPTVGRTQHTMDNLYAMYRKVRAAPFLVNDDETLNVIEKLRPNYAFVYSLERHWAVPTLPGHVKLEGGGVLKVNTTLSQLEGHSKAQSTVMPFDQSGHLKKPELLRCCDAFGPPESR